MKTDIDPGGLLYWDGVRLSVGAWGSTFVNSSGISGTVNTSNVIYAKFGGTVGITFNNGTWAASHIVFNPTSTTYAGTVAGYQAIPECTIDTDGVNYVSSTLHTLTNVKLGRGDICKLVGYTAAQVKAWTALPANPTWRLPTQYENQLLVGDTSSLSGWNSGNPGVMTFSTGHSLPALGYRNMGAYPREFATRGDYWTSSIADYGSVDGTTGLFLTFASHEILYTFAKAGYSMAIRCVRQ